MARNLQAFWLDQKQAGDPAVWMNQHIWTARRTGVNQWGPKSIYYSFRDNPPPLADLSVDGINGFTAGQNVESQSGTSLAPIVLPLSRNSQTAEQLFYIPGNVAPIPIDNAGQPDLWDYFTVSQGPYFYNGFWWLIGNMSPFSSSGNENSPGPVPMAVYRSVDKITWTRQDQANEIGPNFAGFWGNFDGSDSKLRFLYNTVPFAGGVATYGLVEFDMLANGGLGTWGALHDPVVLDTNPFGISQLLYSSVTGISHIFYSPTALHKRYAYLSGGIWTTDIDVAGAGAGFVIFNQALLDPDGVTLHTAYRSSSNFVYQQVGAGGALGPTFHFPSNAGFTTGPGKATVFTDYDGVQKLNFPVDWSVLAGDLSPATFIGFPLANPAFSLEIIDTYPGDRATCTYSVETLFGGKLIPRYVKPFLGQGN